MFPVQAIDPDQDSLIYSLIQEPAGMTIDSTTGQISWPLPTLQAQYSFAIAPVLQAGKRGFAYDTVTDGSDDVSAIGALEDRYTIASGRPNPRIGREEDRDHGRPNGSGKMRDPGIVADEDPGGREPAGQLV